MKCVYWPLSVARRWRCQTGQMPTTPEADPSIVAVVLSTLSSGSVNPGGR